MSSPLRATTNEELSLYAGTESLAIPCASVTALVPAVCSDTSTPDSGEPSLIEVAYVNNSFAKIR